MKAVCGCGGHNVKKLSDEINKIKSVTKEEMYKIALLVGFGCEKCLVVQDAVGVEKSNPDDVGELYRQKFNDPNFNPRWECGLVAEKIVMELQ